jgi:hypothetical protein
MHDTVDHRRKPARRLSGRRIRHGSLV